MASAPATPLSPARLSRLQEKEELRQLNDRLAQYIERVRALELENDRLLLRVSEKEEVVTREVTGIKALYEAELADTRRGLDETARERARLQIEVGKLRAEFEELRKSYKKKDGEWSTSQGRIKELEVLFHRSEAELTATLSEKRSLEAEVAEARAQLAKSEDAHAVAKEQLERETLLRVDLENRCQSLQEELDFRRSIFDEEVRETQKWHERHLVEVDSSHQKEYESKIAQALEDLRRQHDDQVQLYKLELEQTYRAKLENAKLCSDQNERAASTAREELNEARIRIEALSSQLSGLQKQVSTAEERMRDLEELMAGEQEKLRKMLDAKEREMTEMREQMQQQLLEYQELLDVKLALDMEISAYRKLLEGEEERLKLSPSPPSRITVSRATSSSSLATRGSRGKRKRAEAEELSGGTPGGIGSRSSSSSFQVRQQASAKGSVSIEQVDPEGKFVQLKNHSDKDQSLGNWRLKRKIGEGEEIAYKFTPKYILRAGQTVAIWAAEAGVAHCPPSVLVWKNQGSWGTGDHIHMCLVNSDGEGAFGQCYKFTDTSANRVYAVKVLSQQQVSKLGNRGKVQREIELHSQLQHRNIVGFYRHFADQENIYMVLEYCSRKSLAHILKVRRTLTEPEVRFYLKQIMSGLQYLHQQGIIHRDLKLSNVFITKSMQVKIGDLGLATREQPACRRRGVVCGTPNYLAPEVIAKKGHSFQSDLWALGCIMYTALAGFSPFEITQKQELYQRIREGRYPVPGHLSPAARSLIGKLLSADPSARPSLEEVLRHPFFTQHFTPARLSSRTCRSAPLFPFANPLRKFFQKTATFLFQGSPCQDRRTVSPAPQEQEEASRPRSVGHVAPPPSEAEEGSTDPVEEPSCFSPHLLRKGSLRNGQPEGASWGPGGVLETVDRTLRACLRTVPLVEELPEGLHGASPAQMATKWVDYSNKYGFGYMLSSGSTAVLLPDGTHMAFCPQRQCICYCREAQKAVSFGWREVPPSLAAKRRVLHFFTQYMQRWLLEGSPRPSSPSRPARDLSLLHFAKSDKALLMLFSDGSLQVNFYHDRTKIVLSRSAEGEELLTFVDHQHGSTTFPLGTLARQGWTLPLRERVLYALHLLHCL